MKAALVRFLRDEQGQDLVEYALIVAAVGLALITTVNQLSAGIVSLYQSITGDLSSIGTPGGLTADCARLRCRLAAARPRHGRGRGHAVLLPFPFPGLSEAFPRFRRRLAYPQRRSDPGDRPPSAHRSLFLHESRRAVVCLGMGGGRRGRRDPSRGRIARCCVVLRASRSRRASGCGSACTGRWAATS